VAQITIPSANSSCNMRRRGRFQSGVEYSVLNDQCAFQILAPQRRHPLILLEAPLASVICPCRPMEMVFPKKEPRSGLFCL
jgi:hypothetical protein